MFVSCEKGDIETDQANTSLKVYNLNNDDYNLIINEFDFKSIDSIDISNSYILISNIFKTDFVKTNGVLKSSLDINHSIIFRSNFDNSISYSIPFKHSKTKHLIVKLVSNSNERIKSVLLLNNSVDKEGNGILQLDCDKGEYKASFIGGELNKKLSSLEYSKEELKMSFGKTAFRECFDKAYDDICDGLVGCLGWYASPATPIAVAVYCGATT